MADESRISDEPVHPYPPNAVAAKDSIDPAATSLPRWLHVGRALRNANFRLFFGGQFISLIGTWMQQLALSWLVFQVTRDEFWMSLVSFSSQIPSLLLVPFAGVLIDRVNKHRLIIATQALLMVQAIALALTTNEKVPVNQLLAQLMGLAFVQGCLNAFDMPARQAFLPEMLHDRRDLANAIALNSSMFHGARLIGPAIASAVLAAVGFQACFWLNAVSFLAVLASLGMMKVPRNGAPEIPVGTTGPIVPRPVGSLEQQTTPLRWGVLGVLHGFREGLGYAIGFAPIRALLGMVAITSLFGIPYTVFVPYYAGEIFQGDATTLGYMMTASGVGALSGALYMASRPTVLGLGRKIIWGSLLFSVGLMVFAQSGHLWLALAMLPITGFGLMIQMASCNTILQTIVDDRMRGRVMSLYTLSFMGLSPIGILLAGTVARWLGTPNTLLIGGAVCLVSALYFGSRLKHLREFVRPIYIQRGILPTE